MEIYGESDRVTNTYNKSNPRNVDKKPRRHKPSVEALHATIQKKKQCNAKALKIVTEMSESTVTEKEMVENLQFINQDYYQDIIEERAINKLCGYPICSAHLSNIPSKQYHISTYHNKIFDITDRKNFCSNTCYKASKYLKDQILTSPLWLREDKPTTIYTLSSHNIKGSGVGDEVDLGYEQIKKDNVSLFHPSDSKEIATLEVSQPNDIECSATNKELTNSEISDVNNAPSLSKENKSIDSIVQFNSQDLETEEGLTIKEDSASLQTTDLSEKTDQTQDVRPLLKNDIESEMNSDKDKINDHSQLYCASNQPLNKPEVGEEKLITIKSGKKRKSAKLNLKSNSEHKSVCSLETIVTKIESTLKEWLSLESLCFILGEEKIKELLSEKGEQFGLLFEGKSENAFVYDRYLAICKKLNLLELEDTKLDNTYREEVKKPLPDFDILKKQAEEIDLKVRMFYKGDKVVQFKESYTEPSECDREPVLPLVDHHAQKALRRRIVSDKVKQVLQDLQRSLHLRSFCLIEEIQSLISTFDLTAKNCMMRPPEWNLTTIIIIKLLSLKDKTLEKALTSEPTRKHLTLLLLSFSLDYEYLDRLMVWLTDIDHVIKKKC